jgi:predicted PurR-regulated permease PerM
MTEDNNRLVKRTLTVAALYAVVTFTALFIFHVARVLLLVFAGCLIAVFLNGVGQWLHRHAKIPRALGVAVVIVAILTLCGLCVHYLAPQVEAELSVLNISIPEAAGRVEKSVGAIPFGKQAVALVVQLWNGLKQRFQSTRGLGWGIDAVVIIFLSVYLAFQPSLYRRGILALFPRQKRDVVRGLLDSLNHMLWRWFIGRLFAMVVIGLFVFLAMWDIGIPLPLTLGVIAGVLEFVPYLGAVVSAIPGVLLALLQGPFIAGEVIVVYLILHIFDGYVVIPLVERRAVRLAPGLTIVVQVAMFFVAGFLGLLIADPLAAAVTVILDMFYIERPVEEA